MRMKILAAAVLLGAGGIAVAQTATEGDTSDTPTETTDDTTSDDGATTNDGTTSDDGTTTDDGAVDDGEVVDGDNADGASQGLGTEVRELAKDKARDPKGLGPTVRE